jgi:FkbM family methyltransferase
MKISNNTIYRVKNFLFGFYERIFSRKIFQRYNSLLFDLALRGKGIGSLSDISQNGEAKFLRNISKIFAEKEIIAFDVGANIGDYTDMISRFFKNNRIYAFEPHPKSYELLKQKFKGKDNIILYQFGLGSSNYSTKLYDYKDSDFSPHASTYGEMFNDIYKRETTSYEIEVITLDSFIEREKIESIDLLKIDVEGGELEVLKGAKEALSRNKIKIIQFEFNYTHIISRVFLKDFYNLLHNFEFYRILRSGLLKLNYDVRNEIFIIQNIVAINKNNPELIKRLN